MLFYAVELIIMDIILTWIFYVYWELLRVFCWWCYDKNCIISRKICWCLFNWCFSAGHSRWKTKLVWHLVFFIAVLWNKWLLICLPPIQ